MYGHHRALLIVEDHEMTRRILAMLMARHGWEVQAAATVAEGLDLLETEPDCVVLDLMLPDGDGEEILRRVREGHLKTRVVVATATGDEARLGRLRGLRPDGILRKPIVADEINRACQPAPA